MGKLAAKKKLDRLYAFGELSREAVAGAKAEGIPYAQHFKEKTDMAQQLKKEMQPGDVIWFKGSRGMKLEEVITQMYGEC